MKKLTLLLLIPIIIMVLFSVYNANEKNKKLDAIEEEIDEKIRIAKEKIQQKDSASINADSTIISVNSLSLLRVINILLLLNLFALPMKFLRP